MPSLERIFRILREAVGVTDNDKARAMTTRALIEIAELIERRTP